VDRTIRCEISKRIKFIWDKEGLPEEWKEFLLIVLIYKKGDNRDCNNFRGISVVSTAYKTLPNILLSRLASYAGDITVDNRCGFRRNRSTIDHIIYIRHILEKKWEYKQAVHQLFIDFKKAYGSVSREDLYNILIQFGIPINL